MCLILGLRMEPRDTQSVVWCGVRTVEWCNVESVVQLSQLSPHSPNTTAQLLGKGDLTLVSQLWDVLPTHHNIHNLVDTTIDVSQLSIFKARKIVTTTDVVPLMSQLQISSQFTWQILSTQLSQLRSVPKTWNIHNWVWLQLYLKLYKSPINYHSRINKHFSFWVFMLLANFEESFKWLIYLFCSLTIIYQIQQFIDFISPVYLKMVQ